MSARGLRRMLLLAALAWCASAGRAAAAEDLDRAYHEAWFAWAVEGRWEDGRRQLRDLARRADLSSRWQARIDLDLVRVDLLLGEDREAWNRAVRLRRGAAGRLFPAETEALLGAAEAALHPEPPPPSGDEATDPERTDPPETQEPPPEEEPEFILPLDSPGTLPPPTGPERVQVLTPAEAARVAAGVLPESPEPQRWPQSLPDLLEALDRRAARWRDSLLQDGAVSRVVALVGRRYAHTLTEDSRAAYDAVTFSFVYGTRDQRQLTHNDWDVQFGNGGARIHLDMTGGDRGQIWDVGRVEFEDFQVARPGFAGQEAMPVHPGRVYLLHVLDSDTDLWVALQVLELQRDEWVIFRWRLMEVPD